jgi:hypothetical protein
MPASLIAEGAALAVCFLIVIRARNPGGELLRKLDLFAGKFARRQVLVCISLALLVLIVRTALLPVWPIPRPSIYDEFSYLLQADTFAHGRLVNRAHPLWQFFESI